MVRDSQTSSKRYLLGGSNNNNCSNNNDNNLEKISHTETESSSSCSFDSLQSHVVVW